MFSVATDWQDHRATIAISDDLDLVPRDGAENAIAQAVGTPGADGVIVDLAGLRFLDSCGIAVLVKCRRQADAAGMAYRVTGPTDMVRQVLSLTGVLDHLSGETG